MLLAPVLLLSVSALNANIELADFCVKDIDELQPKDSINCFQGVVRFNYLIMWNLKETPLKKVTQIRIYPGLNHFQTSFSPSLQFYGGPGLSCQAM